MSQSNTQNIDNASFQEPSDEYLIKVIGAAKSKAESEKETKERLAQIEKLASQAKNAREKAYKQLNEDAQRSKNITKEQIEENKRKIDESIQNLYKRPFGIPIIDEKLGKPEIKHKDKLGFVYIGDVAKSVSEKNTVNAPKIAMAIGGGLEYAFNPVTNESNKIFPQNDRIEGASAQLHLISLSDIDVKGILTPTVTTLYNRSAIKAEADVLEFSSNEMVIIRSLGRPYNSKGSRVLAPGGVHIISGQNSGDNMLKEPQPMVLGNSLSAALLKMTEAIGEIVSMLIGMNSDMLTLKTALMAHTHVATSIASPTTPSFDLIAAVSPTMSTKTYVNVSNGYSQLHNLEMFKINVLSPLSENKFISDFNRVN